MSQPTTESVRLFESRATRLRNDPLNDVTAVYQWEFDDAPGEDCHLLTGTEQPPRVVRGRHSAPTIRLSLALRDHLSLLSGQQDPLTAYTTGRLRLSNGQGDPLAFPCVQRLLLLLLVDWHVTPENIKAIEDSGSRLHEVTTIERVKDISQEEFEHRFASQGKPVILQGPVERWKAAAYTPASLRDAFGDLPTSIFVRPASTEPDTRTARPAASQERTTSGRTYVQMTLREYIDTVVLQPAQRAPGELPPYLTANSLDASLMELIEYPPFFRPEAFIRPKLWLGPAGTVSHVHRDLIDNFLAQVWGRKHLRLFSPDQSRFLYPRRVDGNPFYEASDVDVSAPDLEKFPELRHSRPVDCELRPGEMLYLPAGWWHYVRSLDTSLSVNFFAVNQPPRVLKNRTAEQPPSIVRA
ncbi:MAG TPA: cupin-like domain-containing protein [Archangium sp.]|nr:cupin-like domain-containing protein [Archangium sp.]